MTVTARNPLSRQTPGAASPISTLFGGSVAASVRDASNCEYLNEVSQSPSQSAFTTNHAAITNAGRLPRDFRVPSSGFGARSAALPGSCPDFLRRGIHAVRAAEREGIPYRIMLVAT